MKKIGNLIQIAVFLLFIGGFFVLNAVSGDVEFSEQENRYLEQKPEFSVESLFSGDFTLDYESYVTDQFAMRDAWVSLKAASELALGKMQNKGVFLCDTPLGQTLIENFEVADATKTESSVSYINTLAENVDVPVYFALIPDKAYVWGEYLPENVPNDSQADFISFAYGLSEGVNLDILSALSAHRDEYIFYRTDHHWTTLGAYYAYATLMEAMGMEAHDISDYDVQTVSEDFYGTTWSSSGFSWVAPDSMDLYVSEPEELSVLNYRDVEPVEGVLYDYSYLDAKDKYSMFFGGNTPLLQIDTGIEDAPSILIVRDSYADSMTPFLLDSFSEVHVIDLRYYRLSIADYVAENEIDNVLVMYNTVNFSTDSNLFLLAG